MTLGHNGEKQMKNRLSIVFVCVAMMIMLVSCGKGSAKAKAVNLKATIWLEDYGVRDVYRPMAGRTQPQIYYNFIIFDDEGATMGIRDDYGEYEEIFNKEFEIDKDNVFTIYLYPKADVLPIKEKQPAEWLSMKDDLIITGQFQDDTITLPSKRRDKDGKREFKKTSQEEFQEILTKIKAEFDEKDAEYSKAMEEYRSMFK